MFNNSVRISLDFEIYFIVDSAYFEIPDALKHVFFLYMIFFLGRFNKEWVQW